MQASNFSQFTVQGAGLRDLVKLYGAWVVGEGEFAGKRRDRLRSGVPEQLSAADFVSSRDHVRTSRSQVRTRVISESEWVLQWVHSQSNDHDVHWHNVVRLSGEGDGVHVEHLVGRVFPPGQRRPPIAAPPQTISRLVEQYGNRIRPRNLFGGARELDFNEADDFIRYILLDEGREANIVVVSTTNQGRKPLVNPEHLAASLAGMATVYTLAGPKTSWAFSKALDRLELGEEFGCYDGAVRLYRPGFNRSSNTAEHPLLLPWWISEAGYAKARMARVSGRLVELLTRNVNVASWFNVVGRHDVERQKRATEALVQKTLPAPSSASEEALRKAVAERDEQIEDLKGELKAHQELLEEAAQEVNEAHERATLAQAERDQMEQERDEAVHAAENADGMRTLADALIVAEKVFGDRLLILSSAHKAAADSPYRYPDRVFMVLALLAGSKGDRAFAFHETLEPHFAKGVKWRPKDSPQTLKKFKDDRTFTCSNGQRKLFKMHVTFGGSEDPYKNAQLYYDVLPNGQIEVAHVGRHLRTVSHNT